jgi:hypothetical protein
MAHDWWLRIRGAPLARRIVVIALVVALVFLGTRLIEGARFFTAFTQAGVIALLLMAVLATAHSLWRGDDLDEAEAGGVRLRFSAARKAVGAIERRLDAHTRSTDKRLLDLEREVFKNDGSG